MAVTPHDATRPETSTTGPPGPASRARGAPLVVAASVAAAWAALISFLPLALVSLAGGFSADRSLAAAARFAAAGWLLGHGVPVEIGADRVTLIPLAVTLLAAWRVSRAGVHASRAVGGHRDRRVRRAAMAAGAVALAYGCLGGLVATAAAGPTLGLSPLAATVHCGLFGFVFAGIAAMRHSRAGRGLIRRAPPVVDGAVRTGVAAAALILAAGAATAGTAVAAEGGTAATILGSYRAGVVGQAGITALCLAYSPNTAVWGASYLLGPGFSVGAQTVVRPGAVVLGPVPALPLLAGLPSAPAPPPVVLLLLGVPVFASVAAGWLLGRRDPRHSGVAAWVAGPVAGVLVQIAVWASAGALGAGRLAALGPTGWRAGVLATVVVAFGASLGSLAARSRFRRAGGADGTGAAKVHA